LTSHLNSLFVATKNRERQKETLTTLESLNYAKKMSGLLGAVDKAYHHVKGDQEVADEKHTVTGK